MNLSDILVIALPISSAALGLVTAICSSILTKQIKKKRKDAAKIVIKLNDRQVEIAEQDKEKLMEMLSQIIDEKDLSSLKTEDSINKEKPPK